MSNPLLADYVKKHSHGWAHALNFIGAEIGSITAFYIALNGYDSEHKEILYYSMTGVVLLLGLVTSIFLVKDVAISREYVKDSKGKHVRVKS